MPEKFISIDLGGTKCAGAVISNLGKIILKSTIKLGDSQGDDVGSLIANLCDDLIEEPELEESIFAGIGISVPGISYKSKGTVWAPNIPGWNDYPLKDKIEKRFNKRIPVIIDSDRACSILGESWLGAASGCQNVIYLTFGTGIGAGIMTDGRILRGKSDIAGAIGWLALDDRYPAGYKQFGCFEYNASGDGLRRLALDVFQSDIKYSKTTLDPTAAIASDIFNAYEERDVLACEVIEKAIEYWGKAVANVVSIFNPEKIIFGGGLFGPGLKFLDEIHKTASKYAQPVAMEEVELCSGKLGNDAQLYGAAKLLME